MNDINSGVNAPVCHPVLSLTLTRFTASKPAVLSKSFALVGNVLDKRPGGNMIAGMAERLTVTLADFAALLPTLKPSQACSYGVAVHDAARIVVAAAVSTSGNGDLPVIARTRDYFAWPEGAGLMMLDYDASDDAPPLSCSELRDALAMACLPLDSAPAIWRPSASSCIHVKGGAELRGIAGQRVYIPVIDAGDIERAGQVLFDRLWLAGHGRYELSKSGAWLARSPIDAAVFQPERFDFNGGAALGAGLEQRLPDPVTFNPDAPYLDTRAALPDLSDAERVMLAALRETLKTPELLERQVQVKEQWVNARVAERLAGMPTPAQAAAKPSLEATYRQAVNGGWLAPQFELTVVKTNGSKTVHRITVEKALAQKTKYHEATCLDPLEPDYPDGASRDVGWLNLAHKPPYITSQAHGGIRYNLGVAPAAEPGLKVSFTPAPGSPWRVIPDDAPDSGDAPDWFGTVVGDAPPDGPDSLLVDGKSLLKHNDAASILFKNEFDSRLFYDPIQLDWFEYQSRLGVFEHRPGLAIEKAVYQAINKHRGSLGFDTGYVSGVTRCLLYEAIAQPKPVVGKICFTNGVLDLATRELLPHSPDFYFTSSLPFAWNADAQRPELVIDWLRAAVGGHDDQVELLRAYLNAVVVGRPDLQRFLELIGAGGSGKGTFVRLAQALVGRGGSHSTRLKELEENRFETANLFNKRLVVIGDAEKWHGSVDVLKSITGEDSIRFEQKHKQGGEDFVYGGMVIIAGNQHTDSNDYSSGIQRRKITVPFDHVVAVSERRDLAAEFEPLLPAVLKWVLDMPQSEVTARLRNTSTHTASLKAARLDALSATNPMVAWLLDNVHFDENVTAQVGDKKRLTISVKDFEGETVTRVEYQHEDTWLYPNYCRWCDQGGKMPVSKNQFSTTLVDVAKNLLNKPYVARARDSSGARCIQGMTLTLPTGRHTQPDPYRPDPAPTPSPWTGSPLTTNDDPRQPTDNLLTTQSIDSDDSIYLEPFLEVNNYLADIAEGERERAAFECAVVAEVENVGGDSGKPCGGNEQGCQYHQNQDVKLSEGCQRVVSESSSRRPADGLTGDAALLATVLALYRGAETDKRLAQKMGWETARVVGAAQALVSVGCAEMRSGMIKPTGRLVAEVAT
jgi:P4 family phage/plasmid primase-like protien